MLLLVLYHNSVCLSCLSFFCFFCTLSASVVNNKVPTLLLIKKFRTFPGLSSTPMKNFPGPFRSPRMFKYKEKTAFTYNIQSVVHCRKFSIWSLYTSTCSDCRSSLEVFQFQQLAVQLRTENFQFITFLFGC